MLLFRIYPLLLLSLFIVMTTDVSLAQVSADPIRRVRAVYNFDPSTQVTIGFENVSGIVGAAGPQLYYSSTDHGTDRTAYAADNPPLEITEQIVGRGMNNAFFQLTGLTPGTNYYFVISDGINASPRYYVKTIPDDNNYRLKIIAGGDSRNAASADPNAAILVEARQNANLLVSKMRADAIFFGGDMTLQDTEPEWFAWLDHWEGTFAPDGYITPIIPARGNHEYFVFSVREIFYSPNANSVYGVKFADDLLHLSTLNSETTVAGDTPDIPGSPFQVATMTVEDQGAWLDAELGNNDNACTYWKMAQYHRPTRPHETSKSLKDNQRDEWSRRFDKYAVQLVCESDAHVTKYTHPIRVVENGFVDPVTGHAEDEGFVRDDANGTTYIGEGGWGAELRPGSVKRYDWTIADTAFNQFKLIFIDKQKIEVRNIITDDASDPQYPFLSETDSRFDMTPFDGLVWKFDNADGVITVTNVTPPTTQNAISTTTNVDNTFTLDAGTGYHNYNWSNGATTQMITVTNPGDYMVTVSNRARCERVATTTISGDALSVEMLTFEAKEVGTVNQIDWTTTREIVHDFFVVEASTDAKNFVAVGQLDGAGDAKTITSYRFIDKSPLAKRTYYRLQQIDIDGRISYSKIISVERKAQTRLQIRRIIPNPVAVDARLQFTAQTMQTVNYRIMNAAGELLLHDQIQPTIGNNEVPVATASLSAGIYFVILEQGEDRVSYRFVKK